MAKANIKEIKNNIRKLSAGEEARNKIMNTEESDVILVPKSLNRTQRKRVAFDIRIDLHKELKILSVQQEVNLFELVEKAVDDYIKKLK